MTSRPLVYYYLLLIYLYSIWRHRWNNYVKIWWYLSNINCNNITGSVFTALNDYGTSQMSDCISVYSILGAQCLLPAPKKTSLNERSILSAYRSMLSAHFFWTTLIIERSMSAQKTSLNERSMSAHWALIERYFFRCGNGRFWPKNVHFDHFF